MNCAPATGPRSPCPGTENLPKSVATAADLNEGLQQLAAEREALAAERKLMMAQMAAMSARMDAMGGAAGCAAVGLGYPGRC
jgi:cysteine sulfinate desulfinase/cysteine desulfurase-like protein